MREIRTSADVPAHTDSPPALRFELTSAEDRILSEQTKRPEFMNQIKVYMRAPGDMKTEVPDVAEMTAYEAFEKDVDVERTIPKYKENAETHKIEETTETISFREKRTFYQPKVIHPWMEKLKFQLNAGQISERYYRACLDAFEQFKNKQNLPKDGFPLINWKGIDPAMRDKLLGMGINTVELVASMTEEAMTYVGMGSRSIKQKAEAFLLQNNAPEQAAIEMTIIRQQNEALAEQLSAMQAKMAELGERQQEKSLQDKLRAQYTDLTGQTPDMRWGPKKLVDEIEAAEKEARAAA
jgi:hypothetical protein